MRRSRGNIRRHPRDTVNTPLQIMWKDRDGNDKYTNARSLDVSESGMRVEVPEPLPERSYVILRADALKLHGTASVRSCMHKGTKFVVGLEFSAGMRYKPRQNQQARPKPPSRFPSIQESQPGWDEDIKTDPFFDKKPLSVR